MASKFLSNTLFEVALSKQNHFCSMVLYTDLKSCSIARLSLAEGLLGIIGFDPDIPPFTLDPNKNIGAALPWSVPVLALLIILLPNSLKVMPITRSSIFNFSKSSWKALIASDTVSNKNA